MNTGVAIRLLLQRLLLEEFASGADHGDLREFSLQYVSRLLGEDREQRALIDRRVQLRLALHLAPAAAVSYDPRSPTPRHRLVRKYLEHDLELGDSDVDGLARRVAAVLAAWQEERERAAHQVGLLKEKQRNRCAHCGFRFGTIPMNDLFKPYSEAIEELTSPEVDHVQPISGSGTNDLRNLQCLCRLCNAGKGDGLGIDLRAELEWAGKLVADIPRAHRIRFCYFVIERDARKCTKCGAASADVELTIRPLRTAGALVRTNLRAVCVTCAAASDAA